MERGGNVMKRGLTLLVCVVVIAACSAVGPSSERFPTSSAAAREAVFEMVDDKGWVVESEVGDVITIRDPMVDVPDIDAATSRLYYLQLEPGDTTSTATLSVYNLAPFYGQQSAKREVHEQFWNDLEGYLETE